MELRPLRAGEPITVDQYNVLVAEIMKIRAMTAAYPLGLVKGASGYHFYSVQTTAEADDKFVAVASGETPGYLKDVVEIYNDPAQYTANKDFIIESEATGSTPNKKLRQFVQLATYPGYNAGAAQTIGKNSSNDIELCVWSGHSPWIVVANSSNTWTISHAGPNSGETATEIGATINKISGGADTTAYNFTLSTNAGFKWMMTSWYQSAAGGDVDIYGGYVSFDSFGHANLLSGETLAGTITMPTGGTDVKMAVTSTSTADYLENLATAWNASAIFQIASDPLVYFEANGDEFLAYLDWSLDPNYNASSPQLFGHDSGSLVGHWDLVGGSHIVITESPDPTWELELEHGNPVDESTGTVTVTSAVTGTDLTAETDSFTANGTNYVSFTWYTRPAWDATNKLLKAFPRTVETDKKGHVFSVSSESSPTTIADLSAAFVDEKVSTASGETPNYLAALLTDLATSGVVLGIDFETTGSTPNKTVRAKIDLSGVSGYNAAHKQALIHNAGTLAWYDIEPCGGA